MRQLAILEQHLCLACCRTPIADPLATEIAPVKEAAKRVERQAERRNEPDRLLSSVQGLKYSLDVRVVGGAAHFTVERYPPNATATELRPIELAAYYVDRKI